MTPDPAAGARPPCAGTVREGLVASLALVAVQLRHRADWLVAIAAAVLAVALALVLSGNWHIVVTGLVGSAVAAWVLPLAEAEPSEARAP